MARHRYLIIYPNGIRRHVNRLERDLLASSLTQIAPREYRMPSLSSDIQLTSGSNYLDLELVFEYPPKRVYEREQTLKGMIARLQQMGFTGVCAEVV
jgi:hypothetical protein